MNTELRKNTKIDKIALSANDDKRIQSIDSVETYAYRTNEETLHQKEDIKCNSIIKVCESCITMTMIYKKT